jgi:hypothetical protein
MYTHHLRIPPWCVQAERRNATLTWFVKRSNNTEQTLESCVKESTVQRVARRLLGLHVHEIHHDHGLVLYPVRHLD